MKKIILLTLTFFSLNVFAAQECSYNFQLANATIEILDNSQVVQQNFTISRGQNSPDGLCKKYRVFFSKGLANSYQRKAYMFLFGGYLNYNLHQLVNQSGILKDFGDAVSANEFIEGNSPDRFTTYTNRLFISVPGTGSSVLRSGTYYDIVQASVYGYNQSSGNYLFEETSNFTVVIYVPKKVYVSILDEGGVFDASSTTKVIDFGILALNQERGADLRVLSNGSYQLKLSSQNNGNLTFSNGETVAYALRVNGSSVSLSGTSSSPVTIGSGDATSNQGDRYNLKVRITESTNNKSAGMYQDIITITAIAN